MLRRDILVTKTSCRLLASSSREEDEWKWVIQFNSKLPQTTICSGTVSHTREIDEREKRWKRKEGVERRKETTHIGTPQNPPGESGSVFVKRVEFSRDFLRFSDNHKIELAAHTFVLNFVAVTHRRFL